MSKENLDKVTQELKAEGALELLVDNGEAEFFSGLRAAVQSALALPAWKGRYIVPADCPALVKDVRKLLKKAGFKTAVDITAVKGKLEFIVKEAGV